MNSWSAISRINALRLEQQLPPRFAGTRRIRLIALAALVPAACAAVVIADSGSSPVQASARAPAVRVPVPAPIPAPSEEPATIRVTGVVGQDLSRSLEAAGVPEKQGREYVAALATAIPLSTGLSVADRFDLVILKADDGSLGEVAYAGLDRVGRSDLELMKWTDGHEVRWINNDGLDPSAKGMEMPVQGRISSKFGERFHPILHAMRMHKGVDLAARFGSPIVAAADGRVVSAGWHGGYGREVAIKHGAGVESIYGHMSRIAAAAGSYVRRGQVIGYVGSSGLSTGPHLHFEVRKNGTAVNPLSVQITQSPLQGEELHAFRSQLRGLLMAGGS